MTGHEREVTSTGVPPWKSPIALSVVLHLIIIGIAVAGWSWTSADHEPPPRSISARLISPQPKASPVVEKNDQPDHEEQRKAEQKKLKAEAERKEQARKQAEEKARKEAERKAREQEQKRKQAEKTKQEAQAKAKAKEAARLKAEAEEKARQRKKAEAEKKKQAEAKRKAEEEKRRIAEQKKREEAERLKQKEAAERKRQEAERRLREQQLKALAEQAKQAEDAAAREQAQAAAAKAREAEMMTEAEKYQALIRERLSDKWFPPSSATEEMTARLQITLLPTGELAGVKLISGSGNTAFDNSALSAVRSLNRYPIPDEQDTFERYFRQFTIEFNPRTLK